MSTRRPDRGGAEHRFGGAWTEQKLGALAEYLRAYTTALKNTTFHKAYIDAFAGSGSRSAARDRSGGEPSGGLLFPDLAEAEPVALLDGSARLALRTEPPFDQYVFIDIDPSRCAALGALRVDFPSLADRIDIQQGEANATIREICAGDWRSRRAVLFLDPYGMQVAWATLEAIASTKAIDLWLLFPLAIGVNRLLTKSGDIPAPWRQRLNLLLGTEDWYDEFYRVNSTPSLFGTDEHQVAKAKVDVIGRWFNKRLAIIFAGVAEQPGILRNTRNSPLYLLCFAVGNERGTGPALRIAEHILKDLR